MLFRGRHSKKKDRAEIRAYIVQGTDLGANPPTWYFTHNDARLCRVAVHPAKLISQVPFHIRLQARVVDIARRQAEIDLNKKADMHVVTARV